MSPHRPDRRARTVALIGLVFSVLLTVFFILLSVWSDSQALRALTLMTGAGVGIWLFLVLIYHQRVLVQDEAFDLEQLRRERAAGVGGEAIFDADDEQLLLARRRLGWMHRWMLPAFTFVIVGGLLLAALVGWSWKLGHSVWADDWKEVQHVALLIWFVGGAAFLSFLFSRYATGMARQPEWRMLRAGASWLIGITLAAVAVAGSLAALHFTASMAPEHVVAQVIRVLLIVLALEITLNFVLDFYRPRGPEEEPRPAFDSRLLGLFSEPGGLARSIADAINYQFGFEVSSTWFYKLLQRSVVPLLGFAVAGLLAASSLVFIDSNEAAVVERFGRPQERILGPGLHVKYPWPIDVTYKVATARIHELKIGESDENGEHADELILWTNKHSQEPHLEVLVATPRLAEFLGGREEQEVLATRPAATLALPIEGEEDLVIATQAVPVSLMRVAVVVQYRIRDAVIWISRYKQPEMMLEKIINREVIRYCASVDVAGLLGPQREMIEKALHETIQQAAEDARLDVDIVFLGLQGVHPPEDTAQDFQDVVGAEQKKMATIESAVADYNKRLSEVAGDKVVAERLVAAVRRMNALEDDPSATEEELQRVRERVDALFFGRPHDNIRGVGGKAAERLVRASAQRWEIENQAHGRAIAFVQEMMAKNAAPEVYRMAKAIEALIETAGGLRKYIIATDPANSGTLHLNLQDAMAAPFETALEEPHY